MIRPTDLRAVVCGSALAIVACTAKSDNPQDTAMVVTGDTSMSASTTTTAGPSTSTTTSGGAVAGTSASTTTSGSRPSAQPNHSIDLNTATDAEILSIPGVGQRMLHEFKEYRPYTSMDQFRREIGKYVDKAEVARLERYVTIKQ
jgi:DNA uptake protein ComE-like DNA-binding protein